MDVENAARRLAEQFASPRGALTIVPWHGDKRQEIRVWYGSDASASLKGLPSVFEGYPVVAEPRPNFKAH
jgi:hypothetical protein